ncbi:RimJ/RimL family protein N-acetyltransferase [Rhizobium pisi]|uniref:RimJ/RimL family protein N-acetyltransferase n=2 Tax=Rhizobium pisi TaxID=574561 RepID=A0A7W5BNS9_9HYPH|nr:GNAT family N-acetyltransferase [Rhizobium pisi]MBB3136074.1 RimJ/RimL family protein N-acetyltransferase [Rhizobium pisi]
MHPRMTERTESHRHVPRQALVRLRPVADCDRPLLFSLRRDNALQSLLLTVPDATDDAALDAWIERRRTETGGAFLVIEDQNSGKAEGYVQITQVHRRNATGYGGIVLAEGARGLGLGRAALAELARHASRVLGLRKLMAEIDIDNAASIGLHLSLGYREVGLLEAHFADANGMTRDVMLFERRLGDE